MMKYVKMYHDWLAMLRPLTDAESGRLLRAVLAYAATGEELPLKGPERYLFPAIRLQIDRDGAKYEAIIEKRRQAGASGGNAKSENKQMLANASICKQDKDEDKDKDKDKDEDKDEDKDKDEDTLRGESGVDPSLGSTPARGARACAPDGREGNASAPDGRAMSEGTPERRGSAADGNRRGTRFTPPTAEEVGEYCRERGNGIDARAFVDFYESKGWMVGSNRMKDWRACVRTWEQKDGRANQAQARAAPYAATGRKAHFNPFLDALKEGRYDEPGNG